MKTTCAPVLLAVLFAGAAQAQESPTPLPTPSPAASPAPRRSPTQLHVQLVVSRTQAGKAVSRLPYTMTCIADGSGRTATLRMGVEVPVSVGGGKGIQYRNVGINIDTTCEFISDDRFRLKVALEQSSISDVERAAPARAPGTREDAVEAGNPMFRTFNSTFQALLRDGQSALSTVATDPVTGDEVAIEATLKVLK